MRGWQTLCCLLAETAVAGQMIGVDVTVCTCYLFSSTDMYVLV